MLLLPPCQVHLYTLRNEPVYLPPFNSIDEEYTYFFKTLGVEGGFTDFPGTLVPWTRSHGPWQRNLWVNA
jgi:glycerophosphoryl diester phosphodiesterase